MKTLLKFLLCLKQWKKHPDAFNALFQRSMTTDIHTNEVDRCEKNVALHENDIAIAQNNIAIAQNDVAVSVNDVMLSDNAVDLLEKPVELSEKMVAFLTNDDVLFDNDISRFECYETRALRESNDAIQLWIKNILEKKNIGGTK